MATSAFKDLVIDATDARRAAEFWAAALGLVAKPNGTADAVLTDSVPEHTIWINQVPEPRTVKQRVHLDLHVGAVSRLLDLGATIDNELPQWTVMRDPEGGEFCAFVREPDKLPSYRLYELVIDCDDPAAVCGWWAERLGLTVQEEETEEWRAIEGGSLPWAMIFDTVPEAKTVKNRIHWDVWGETEDYLAAGATLLRRRDDEISWDVLADPEGNEFCVFTR
jgi:hypothetical protein